MIKIVCGGKKSVGWVAEGVAEYEKRLRKPFEVEWRFVEEGRLSEVVLGLASGRDLVILLDERGEMWDSPALSRRLAGGFEAGGDVVIGIGGAYGFSEAVLREFPVRWSLSKLVFPHQICRLLVAEQIYRAQEIYLGRPYHHG